MSRELMVMVGVASSRVGLWGFDLSERQALQTVAAGLGGARGTNVRTRAHTRVGGGDGPCVALFATEKALTEAASLAMLLVSLRLSDVDSFGALATLSLLAVTGAAALVQQAQLGQQAHTLQREQHEE